MVVDMTVLVLLASQLISAPGSLAPVPISAAVTARLIGLILARVPPAAA
jgi:hypothetical protein